MIKIELNLKAMGVNKAYKVSGDYGKGTGWFKLEEAKLDYEGLKKQFEDLKVAFLAKNKRHMYKNPEYKKYQKKVSEQAKKIMGKKEPIKDKRIKVFIKCCYRTKHNRDVDSPIKGLLDALSGIIYEDDVLIEELWAKKEEGTKDKIQIGIKILEDKNKLF